jgi:group II intron reverse transcriptase/maturase
MPRNQTMSTKIQYKKIISIAQLTLALKKTKTNHSTKLFSETRKEFNEEKIMNLHKELKSQTYQPKPIRRIKIPKQYGAGYMTLGIASQKDVIVQTAILTELEPTLDNIFSVHSFGFRPGRNCHDALHKVKYCWQNTTWLITIDIQKYFNTLNHKILIKELYKYCDQATVEVLIKMLKCGYVNLETNVKISGLKNNTLEGSLISPILSNLYLHALDSFIENVLIKTWTIGEERRFACDSVMKKRISVKDKLLLEDYPELKGSVSNIKYNRWLLEKLSSRDSNDKKFKRLYYVRYANDFLLGFCGTKVEAEGIKEELVNFLQNDLKLAINFDKSKIYHSQDNNILFLGCYIRYLPNKIVTDKFNYSEYVVTQLSQVMNNASLKAPINRLLEKATEKNYAVKNVNGKFRATSRRSLVGLPEKDIVNLYSNIIKGILQYYSCVNQRSDLWPVVSLYRKSCALTLADKLKLRTAAQTFKKFGPFLSIKDLTGKEVTKLHYPKSLKTNVDFKRGHANIDEFSCIYKYEI